MVENSWKRKSAKNRHFDHNMFHFGWLFKKPLIKTFREHNHAETWDQTSNSLLWTERRNQSPLNEKPNGVVQTLAMRMKMTNLGFPSSSILGNGGGWRWNWRPCMPLLPLASTTNALFFWDFCTVRVEKIECLMNPSSLALEFDKGVRTSAAFRDKPTTSITSLWLLSSHCSLYTLKWKVGDTPSHQKIVFFLIHMPIISFYFSGRCPPYTWQRTQFPFFFFLFFFLQIQNLNNHFRKAELFISTKVIIRFTSNSWLIKYYFLKIYKLSYKYFI